MPPKQRWAFLCVSLWICGWLWKEPVVFFVLCAIVLSQQMRRGTARWCDTECWAMPSSIWNQISRATEICPSVMVPSLLSCRPWTWSAVSRCTNTPSRGWWRGPWNCGCDSLFGECSRVATAFGRPPIHPTRLLCQAQQPTVQLRSVLPPPNSRRAWCALLSSPGRRHLSPNAAAHEVDDLGDASPSPSHTHHRRQGNRTIRRQTNSRSVKSWTGHLTD